METKILKPSLENLEFCVELLKKNEIVGVPTETVYGLAANAFSDEAVLKIFKTKNRPADNPLICHVSSLNMFKELTNDRSEILNSLIENFWPGPLTIIVKKSADLSKYAVAGLNTVGIRFSKNKILNRLIDLCGFPLAAPSANLSKKPSSTNAVHVFTDFFGKIEAVLDGGQCEIGLESTIVKIEQNRCVLLRPGFITFDDLKRVVGDVELGRGVLEKISCNETILSPGLKHRHYSPNAEVILVRGSILSFVNYVKPKLKNNVWCVVFDGEQCHFENFVLTYGGNLKQQARNLFSILRKVDDLKLKTVFFRSPDREGLGLAIFNRLIRAANFKVVNLSNN